MKRIMRRICVNLAFFLIFVIMPEAQAEEPMLTGSGTETDPYLIYSTEDIKEIKKDVNAYYRLENDIDYNYQIVMGADTDHLLAYRFYGCIDGNGHEIKNIRTPAGEVQPYFFISYLHGTIKNIGFRNIQYWGTSAVLGITRRVEDEGIMKNIYIAESSFSGDNTYMSFLTGWNYGTIEKYAIYNSTIQAEGGGTTTTGGVANYNSGKIQDGYIYNISVDADEAGSVSYRGNGIIENTWISEVILDTTDVCDIIQPTDSPAVNSTYYNTSDGTSQYGTGKTEAELKSGIPSEDIYTGWSEETWYFIPGDYPRLRDMIYHTDPPPEPANLTTAPGVYDIELAWDPVPEAHAYKVYLDGELQDSTTETEYTISGLNPGTEYQIGVAATRGGLDSDIISIYESTYPLPKQPSGLHVVNRSTSWIEIAWNSVQNADEYNVYLDGELHDSTTEIEYTISGLTPGTEYMINVSAVRAGGEGEQSLPITAQTQTVVESPPAPAEITLEEHGTFFIEVSWTEVPEAEAYRVYLAGNQVAEVEQVGYTFEALEADTEYTIGVQSVAYDGGEAYTSEITEAAFCTKPVPPGVTYLWVEEELLEAVVLEWDPVPEAEKYRLYRNESLIAVLDPAVTHYEAQVVPGREYEFYVTLVSQDTIESEPSNIVKVQLPIPEYDTETAGIFRRMVDIIKGFSPLIAGLVGVLVAGRILLLIPYWIRRFRG